MLYYADTETAVEKWPHIKRIKKGDITNTMLLSLRAENQMQN